MIKKGFFLLTDIATLVLLIIAMWIIATVTLILALPIALFWSVPHEAYKAVFKAGR